MLRQLRLSTTFYKLLTHKNTLHFQAGQVPLAQCPCLQATVGAFTLYGCEFNAIPAQSQFSPRAKQHRLERSRYICMLTLATAASVLRAGDRKTRVRVRGPLFDWISHSRNSAFHWLISSETFILHPSTDAAAATAAGQVSQALSDVINAFIITLHCLLLDCSHSDWHTLHATLLKHSATSY